jgi:hypothetical protein
MYKMGKWMIRWGQILFVLNMISFFLTQNFVSLIFAGGIALMLWLDSRVSVPPEDKK